MDSPQPVDDALVCPEDWRGALALFSPALHNMHFSASSDCFNHPCTSLCMQGMSCVINASILISQCLDQLCISPGVHNVSYAIRMTPIVTQVVRQVEIQQQLLNSTLYDQVMCIVL